MSDLDQCPPHHRGCPCREEWYQTDIAKLVTERDEIWNRGRVLWVEAEAAVNTLAQWRIDYWDARARLRNYGVTIESLESTVATLRAELDRAMARREATEIAWNELREGIRERIQQYRGSSIEHAVRLDFEKLLKETA